MPSEPGSGNGGASGASPPKRLVRMRWTSSESMRSFASASAVF
jgi:hypothetical protein